MSPERLQKIEGLVQRYRERLVAEWPEGEVDAAQIEDIVLRVEREVLREVTEVMIQEQSGKRVGNRSVCLRCGQPAIYTRQTGINLVTMLGRVRAERAYFYCGRCRDGFCPQDRDWGIGVGNTTPGVQSVAAYLAVGDAYTHVPSTFRRVRPQVHLGTKTIEVIAQCLGARVQASPPRLGGAATRPLVAAVDGVILPVRGGNKEVRCGMIYEPDFAAGRTPEDCAGLRKEYVGTLGSREALVQEVCRRVELRRPSPETRVGAMGDGAHWIWELYAQHLPHREEILDLRHVQEHLAAVAAARYAEPQERAQWLAREKQSLLTVGPIMLISGLLLWEPAEAAAREVRDRELGYFQSNRARMDYPRYLTEGWPIATGAMEGACKHLISDRFKRSGMRWKVDTAEPLIHLRAALLTHPDLDLRQYVRAA